MLLQYGYYGYDLLFELILGALSLIIWIPILIWMYRDAESRGMEGSTWVFVGCIGGCIGCIIYLIVRNDHPVIGETSPTPEPIRMDAEGMVNCPNCNTKVDPAKGTCHFCGKIIHVSEQPQAASPSMECSVCGTIIEPGQKFCQNCGKNLL